MPENIPLKRFNYKISRQISCPYSGCLLIAKWSWVKQLSFDTVYLLSQETWSCSKVVRGFKPTIYFVALVLCSERSGKLMLERANERKNEYHGEIPMIYPWLTDTFISDF